MFEVDVEMLKPNHYYSEDIFSPTGGVIIAKDTKVEEYHTSLLRAFQIKKARVHIKTPGDAVARPADRSKVSTDGASKGADKGQGAVKSESSGPAAGNMAYTMKTRQADFQSYYDAAVKLIKKVMLEVEFTRRIPLMELRAALKPLIDHINQQPTIIFKIEESKIREDYTYHHSVGVALYSILIAKFMGHADNELMQLGLAGLLHDLGKAKIPDSILKKNGPLTEEEFTEIKKHAVYSYDFLKSVTGINAGVALAGLEHHEREDGKGYPRGIKGFEMHPYSKIVAVADVMHAMMSNRDYKEGENIYHVLKHIQEDSFGKLDAKVVTKLLNNILGFFVNKDVHLTNGEVGEIILLNSSDPLRPLVKTNSGFVDLSTSSSIQIKKLVP